MASLKCENIVQYREAFIENNELYIVMEFYENGDLSNLIKQKERSKSNFSEN